MIPSPLAAIVVCAILAKVRGEEAAWGIEYRNWGYRG